MAESVADALWSMLVSAGCQLPAEIIALDNGALSSCTSTLRRPGPAVRHLVHPIPIEPRSHGRSASLGIRLSVPRTVGRHRRVPGPAQAGAAGCGRRPKALRPPAHMSFGEGVLGSASFTTRSRP